MNKNKTNTKIKTEKESANKYFVAYDGQIIKAAIGLPFALRKMDDKCFSKHVNENKNDFADWVINIIGNIELGQKMKEHKNKASLLKFLVDSLADKTLIQKELKKEKHEEEKVPEGFFPKLFFNIRKAFHIGNIAKPNLSETIRGKLFTGNVKELSDLEVIFSQSLEEYRWKIFSLKSKGENTQDCQLYLGTIDMKIREFEQYLTEKNAIDILHLFYCLDDEIKKHAAI